MSWKCDRCDALVPDPDLTKKEHDCPVLRVAELERRLQESSERTLIAETRARKLEEGGDLRDRFAGQAMLGMLTFGSTEERSPTYIADKAYAIADGMLERRKK